MGAIGQIQIPTTVRPGEPCEVVILDGSGVPISDVDPLKIDIDGQCGPRQFLQFPATGRHSILATARDPDGQFVDSVQADVHVDGPSVLFSTEQGLAVPILFATPDLEVPYRFTFSVGEPLSEAHSEFGVADAMSEDRRYVWQFSDEARDKPIVTEVPWVTHDFLWEIDHSYPWTTRTISCQITPEDITAKRTLTISSGVFMLKERGFTTPVTRNDLAIDDRSPGLDQAQQPARLRAHLMGHPRIEAVAE
jgi:hypothetical protein